MKNTLRDNGLSLAMFGFFLLFLLGQSLAGWHTYNDDQQQHNQQIISYLQYLSTGHFWGSVFENWESEFLQMAAYVVLTVKLFQQGSSESKDPDQPSPVDEDPREHQNDPDVPGPVKAGGWKLKLYEASLSIAFLTSFLISFIGHARGDMIQHNQEARAYGEETLTLFEFMLSAEFWFQSMQNWQGEFLAVFSIVVLSIWLRQKGSPESKPVHAPRAKTAES